MEGELSKKDEYTAFKTLVAQHLPETFHAQDVAFVPNITGGKLSWYRHNNAAVPVTQQRLFGRILYFKQYKDMPDCKAKAVLVREPTSIFGAEEFEFPVYKLQAADKSKQQQEYDKADAAAPREVKVTFASQRVVPKRPIKVLAKRPLPRASVTVLNR